MNLAGVLALGVGLALAHAPLTMAAQGAPLLFQWVNNNDGPGSTDFSVNTAPGFTPVPMLWRFDPMTSGIPSARARNTYVAQESGVLTSAPSAWRAFIAYQDAATMIGGNSIDANDTKNTVGWFQAQGYPIDYVFADFEGYYPDGDWSNTFSLINQLRTSPVGANSHIGNYAWFPGSIDLSADYPRFADHTSLNAYYSTSASNGMAGLNVAMPVGYPNQAYLLHASDTYSWGAGWWTFTGLPTSAIASLTYNQKAAIGVAYLSPNQRAAMMYAPLEQVSLAKRNLPAGHQIIPWMSAFLSTPGVPSLSPGQVPTREDNEALLEHCRLRGVDGFYVFGDNGSPAFSGTYSDGTTFTVASVHAYASDMQATWRAMDWFFDLPSQVGTVTADRPLNLLTFKNTGGTYVDPAGLNGGMEWSAYQRGNRILAVISNLGNGAQAAAGTGTGNNGNWQSVLTTLNASLPAESPVVPPGNHLVVQFLTNPTVTNFNSYPLNMALGAAQGWHESAANVVIKNAAGAGDGANHVVSIASAPTMAWFANSATTNPGGIGATANDTMMYSFKVFTGWAGNGSASFAPVVGSGSAVPVPAQQNGPTLWVFTGAQNYWAFGSGYSTGGPNHSTNFPPAPNTWYAIEMIVNPATDLATIYAMNLTAGNGTWTLLQFGSASSLSAGLRPGEESPSLYNGFQISGSAGAQFDGLSAQLYLYPVSPLSSYSPAPPSSSGSNPAIDHTDAPLPIWGLIALAAGILGIASRRLKASALSKAQD